MITIREMMTTSLHTLDVNDNMYAARMLMTEKNIRHIPVLNGSKLAGILTQRDVLKAEMSSLLSVTNSKREDMEKDVRIGDICSTELVTISSRASQLEAARYIQKHKLGCLPVVDNDELVGIVTDSDFVNVAINLLEVAELDDMQSDF